MVQAANYLRASQTQFLVPAMIAMTVAATRLYRSLTNFSSPPNAYDILPFDLSSKLTVVYVIVVQQKQKALKGETAYYRILNSPLSCTNSPDNWK